MRFSNVCIALSLSSATAFVPFSQPKRTFVASTDFAPRTTSLYGQSKKNKQQNVVTTVDQTNDETVEEAVKLEVVEEKVEASSEVVEEKVEVSASVEEKGEEKEIDPKHLIDEECMGKLIDMVQAA